MKKVVLKKSSCSYKFVKRNIEDVSGRTPSSVANNAVDKTTRLSLRALLFTHKRAIVLMHLLEVT